MRKPIIAGNWKMHKNIAEAVDLAKKLAEAQLDSEVEAVICPPFTALQAVSEAVRSTAVKLGAQNMSWADKGAFTGEIAPDMLLDLGCEYVILGHSERREFFAETNSMVNEKVKAAFRHGLKPIVCVGETLQTREDGRTQEWLKTQTEESLRDLPQDKLPELVVAYEPIWAIGTGKSASSAEANEALGWIRQILEQMYGAAAEKIRLQYGGSVKPETIAELMQQPEVDGALVGGASLKADSFTEIINYGE